MNNLEIDMLGDSHQQQLYLRVFLQALYSDSLVEYEDLLELVGYYATLGKANEN
tara:strand:- start:197 stop:358 length:162 start_codon:yes stop_codon:yes gene_type:complete